MDKKLYDLMDWAEIEAVVYSEQDHPERLLGARKVRGGVLVQTFLPDARSVFVKSRTDGRLYPMYEADEAGYFAVILPVRKMIPYEFIARYESGVEYTHQDAYLYTGLIPEEELTLLEAGKHEESYRYMGAHLVEVTGLGSNASAVWDKQAQESKAKDKVYGVHFAVRVPGALRVSVVGNFNHWDGRRHQMERIGDSDIFALFLPEISSGELYKFEVKWKANEVELLSDPYAFRSELFPAGASIVTNIFGYEWADQEWIRARSHKNFKEEPMSVYEVELGSWRRFGQKADGQTQGSFMNYRELAPLLADYVREMGYTHVELLPVMDHEEDISKGYQIRGFFTVAAQCGSPKDFMYFVNYLHLQGIGVILDWIYLPGKYTGEELLFSNLLFWKRLYHADGIRLHDIAPILYLDYGKREGEWIPNEFGGNENLRAVEFFQHANRIFHREDDGTLLIAEESTAWRGVTEAAEQGGLGFDIKWNRGWLNDFMRYMRLDPLYRKGYHESLVFSMIYAYKERFFLILPHDEVQAGKESLLNKMPGDEVQKYGNLRAVFGYLMTHPGKKLQFMGMEFAQREPWSCNEGLHWEELKETYHSNLQKYVKALNFFYRSHPALYQKDYEEEGFEWISCLDADHSIIAFLRAGGGERLLVVCNFTPVFYENFKVGVPCAGRYREIFNSDDEEYGGAGCENADILIARAIPWDGREYSINMDVAPFGISIMECLA